MHYNKETSVNFYQTTRRNNSEDSHLHTHRRENLKSHNVWSYPFLDWCVLILNPVLAIKN
jgi:hypothetical protein